MTIKNSIFRFNVRTLAALVSLVLAVAAGSATAQAYPDKPIRVIYPFQAGGTGDVVLRLVAPVLEQRLGQRLVIEARAGAGGNIGAQAVASSAPDGYTLLLGATNNFAVNQFLFAAMGHDPARAFTPITTLVDVPSVFYTGGASLDKTLQDLVARARQSPGKINFASPGIGTTPHLNAELLAQVAGVQLVHVPYKGLGDAMTSVIAGDTQLYLAGLGAGQGHLKAGKLRALAVGSNARLAGLPDVPTLNEAGFKGMLASNWFALAAPTGTGPDIVARLAGDVRAALATPEVVKRLAEMGLLVGGEASAETAKRISDESKLWERVIRAGKIRAE